MEKTLEVINRMESEGVIKRYAIGGAMAAIFYIEPFTTYDLDIFFAADVSGGLISLAPIYEHLAREGYTAEGESVNVEGWPVQFLPTYNPLVAEAVEQAVEVEFGRTTTRVVKAEHLAAIMLQTGRPKDHARLVGFLEEGVVDREFLEEVLARHDLIGKWREFLGRFHP
ncbi:MAG TPA: hypothetical protein VG148_09530 [Pyrinomonadaceae bacterium]|nr:hypothetical protein [Pyrinomonadaceae bacterium]